MPHSPASSLAAEHFRGLIKQEPFQQILGAILTISNPADLYESGYPVALDGLFSELIQKYKETLAIYPLEQETLILVTLQTFLDCVQQIITNSTQNNPINKDTLEKVLMLLFDCIKEREPALVKEICTRETNLLLHAINLHFELLVEFLIRNGANADYYNYGQTPGQSAFAQGCSMSLIARLLTPDNKNGVLEIAMGMPYDRALIQYCRNNTINLNNAISTVASIRATEKFLRATAWMEYFQELRLAATIESQTLLIFSTDIRQIYETKARECVRAYINEYGEYLDARIADVAETLTDKQGILNHLRAIFGGEGSVIADYAVACYERLLAQAEREQASRLAEEQMLQSFNRMDLKPFGPQ